MAEVTGMTPDKIAQEITNVKSYVDGGLSEKADKSQVTSDLSKKADKSQVTSDLSKKADKTQVTSDLSKKADITYVDSLSPLKSFVGTGFPEGKVSAPVGSIYTDTAATNGAIRWVKESGTGNTGWRVEYGDTDWRNITPESITSGEMLIRRVGNTVMVTLRKIVFTYQSLGRLPSGFHSPGIFIPAKPRNGIEFTLYVFTDENGYTAFTTPSPGDTAEMYGSATYLTNSSWPTTLPGTPA